MREKRFYKKFSVSCVLALCMVSALLFIVFRARAEEPAGTQVTYEEREYKGREENVIPKENGYLFAGWYTSEDETRQPVTNPQQGEKYVAKFVPEKVLSIKAQVSDTLFDNEETNDNNAAIRFVTSIDESTNYREVGFRIKKGSKGEENDAAVSKYVYRALYAVDATKDNPGNTKEEWVPEKLFHSASYYFKTWTIENIGEAAYNTDVTVTPYWITLDGTRVYGTKSIKTVNLGRSWVYVSDEAAEGGEFGTYKHPYTGATFTDALNSIVIKNGGEIRIKESSNVVVPEDTTGKQTWPQKRGFNLTITGLGSQSETLDFSKVVGLEIGDGVTFANMKLVFNGDARGENTYGDVYACGNPLVIKEDVISENPQTILVGGGHNASIKGDTSLTICSGTYQKIFGGGYGGNVTGDTYVKLTNVNVHGTAGTNEVYGGCFKGTVTGNTHLTIGEGYNQNLTIEHKMSAVVYGGGKGESGKSSVVEGDTYVTVTDNAKSNYVYGGGFSYSEVKGTCHVIYEGGESMSIYGGSTVSSLVESDGAGISSSTSVVMNGGTVEEVFGGSNGSSVKGNTNVQILSGTVKRRVYGGCYNNYTLVWESNNHIIGKTNVTIGSDAIISQESSSGDNSICAISRIGTNFNDETAIMVVNARKEGQNINLGFKDMPGVSDTQYTNYLVTVGAGGKATVEDGVLHVKADVPTLYANIVDVTGVRTPLASPQGEGVYPLPELENRDGMRKIEISFSETEEKEVINPAATVTTDSGASAKYATLEEAIVAANKSEDNPVVSLNKDATILEPLVVNNSLSGVTIKSDEVQTRTITYNNTENKLFDLSGTVTIENVSLKGGKSGIYLEKGANVTATDVNVTRSEDSTGDDALAYVGPDATFTLNGNSSIDGKELQGRGVYVEGTFIMEENAFVKNNHTQGAGAGINVRAGGIFNLKNGTVESNVTGGNAGGILIAGDATFTMTGGSVKQNTAENGGGGIMIQSIDATISGGTIENNTANGSKNDANSGGAGIYIHTSGSLTMEGGIVRKNKSAKGAGVYLTGTLNMTGGIVKENTANQGAGLFMQGTADISGGSIERNTHDGSSTGGGAGIFVNNGTLTLSENAAVKGNDGKSRPGAGISSTGTVYLNGGTVEGNITTGNAAGILISSGIFRMTGGTVTGNTAGNGGGGIMIQTTDAIISGGIIEKNAANGTTGGAGICVHAKGSLTLEGGTIQENTAAGNGGGIYIATKDVANNTITGVTVKGNQAVDGAGIYVNTNKAVTLREITIEGNIATGNGGGINVTLAASAVMESGTIKGNTAVNGGGVYTGGNGPFTLAGGMIEANTATGTENVAGMGSGVCVTAVRTTKAEKPFTMTGGTISGHGTVTERNNSLGTVYVAEESVFKMTGKAAVIENNFSSQNGAGVYAAGTFNLTNGTIQSNNASANGAGVYVADTGILTMNGGTIRKNVTTKSGGGIYQDGSVTINSGEISGNQSSSNGGGIYITRGKEITIKDGKVIDNNAAKSNGAGIHADGENTIHLTGKGEISGNTTTATVKGLFVQEAKANSNTSQVVLHTTFIMENEIRFNNLATREKGDPILIIKGSIPDGYRLPLGFHNSATVYIQCDSADIATKLAAIIKDNQLKTSWTQFTPDGNYIEASK